MNLRVEKALLKLECYKKTHLGLYDNMRSGRYRGWYELDFLAVAALKRSLCITSGFCTLMRAKNFVAAAPLLRLEMDTLMRFSAAWLVDDPHQFAREVIEGKQVNKLKDRSGEFMTDSRLNRICARNYPQVSSLYKAASGYVHLSNKHVFNAFQPYETYLEAIHFFDDTIRIFFSYTSAWIATKDTPPIHWEAREALSYR